VQEIIEVANNRAQVLARSNGTPATNRVKADRNRAFRQQGWCFIGLHFVWMIHTQDHEGGTVGGAPSIFARASTSSELICANGVLRTKIARPQAVHAGKQARHLVRRDGREPL